MAFIRKRGKSHQLIESYREAGKVRQRVVAKLRPWETPGDALEGWQGYVANLEERLRQWEDVLGAVKSARSQRLWSDSALDDGSERYWVPAPSTGQDFMSYRGIEGDVPIPVENGAVGIAD